MKLEELESLIADLLKNYGAALRLFAATWSNSPDDCLQQALIKLCQLERQPEDVVAWLYRVVRNMAINDGLSNRRRRKRETAKAQTQAMFVESEWPDFAAADDQLTAQQLTAALQNLEQGIREVVVARIWGNLTFDEIAATCGCSSSSAHRRFETGLQQLRRTLEMKSMVDESEY